MKLHDIEKGGRHLSRYDTKEVLSIALNMY